MSDTEKFWVKRGKTVTALGVPLAIMAAGSDESGKLWWGEYFLLVFYYKHIRLKHTLDSRGNFMGW